MSQLSFQCLDVSSIRTSQGLKTECMVALLLAKITARGCQRSCFGLHIYPLSCRLSFKAEMFTVWKKPEVSVCLQTNWKIWWINLVFSPRYRASILALSLWSKPQGLQVGKKLMGGPFWTFGSYFRSSVWKIWLLLLLANVPLDELVQPDWCWGWGCFRQICISLLANLGWTDNWTEIDTCHSVTTWVTPCRALQEATKNWPLVRCSAETKFVLIF